MTNSAPQNHPFPFITELPPPDPDAIANLTATLRADYAALQNDLEQAHDLAADFQRQLAGKSNEVAHFKVLLEKTQHDLSRMEGHVNELRRERHRLANEAMLATGNAAELEHLKAERDQFRRETDALRTALVNSGTEYEAKIQQQEKEIQRLRTAVDLLRTRVMTTTSFAGPSNAGGLATEPAVNKRITELAETVRRLESMLDKRAPGSKAASRSSDDEFVDISFSS